MIPKTCFSKLEELESTLQNEWNQNYSKSLDNLKHKNKRSFKSFWSEELRQQRESRLKKKKQVTHKESGIKLKMQASSHVGSWEAADLDLRKSEEMDGALNNLTF